MADDSTPPLGAPSDTRWMTRALELARAAGRGGDVPVGAVVVMTHDDGHEAVVGEGENRKERDGDPTAHAEMVALRAAAASLGSWRLMGCTLYATLEPCVMCLGAALQARVDRIVYGASDPKFGALGGLVDVPSAAHFNHSFEVVEGVEAEEAARLMVAFFKALRS